MRLRKLPVLVIGLLVSFALLTAACGNEDDGDAGSEPMEQPGGDAGSEPMEQPGGDAGSEPMEQPGGDAGSEPMEQPAGGQAPVSGSVTISGSSTVEPISVRVAELFEDVQPDVAVTVDGPGTGDGFKLFCEGKTDISNASRQIKDSEAEACAEAGIEYVELRVGIDGIAVMTNENNPVECVNFADVYSLVGPESTGFGKWSDAQALASELGSDSVMPDASLDIYGPGEESGTFDSFIEIVLEDIADERGQDATTRPDYNANADDNVIIQGIQSSDTSLGWVGFAFATNARGVKFVQVDGGDGCVSATPVSIASGEYPVSRSLYIYVNKAKAEANPAVTAYVDFHMSEQGLGIAVSAVKYVNLTESAKNETRNAWASR
ncbi:substrate-binding domain-containing protein [Candidatus Poriferisocius sp.]|uniref:substrate-binding domain-containing protein n=1 Tax=Candidatus Poriferisocius sp. TaxID=3101276 RepID=UPI003B014E4D